MGLIPGRLDTAGTSGSWAWDLVESSLGLLGLWFSCPFPKPCFRGVQQSLGVKCPRLRHGDMLSLPVCETVVSPCSGYGVGASGFVHFQKKLWGEVGSSVWVG